MAAAKFKKVLDEMYTENEAIFKEFDVIHDKFALDKSLRKEFNEVGSRAIEIMRKYESILCGRSEGAGFGNFSHKLADKFWNAIREKYSEVDEIGIE